MSSSSSNPWGEKEHSFNHSLRAILSSIPKADQNYCVDHDNDSIISKRLAWQIVEPKGDKEMNLISKLRIADSLAAARRDGSLNVKLNIIVNEVNDVLAAPVVKDMESMLDRMAEKLKIFSDARMLENITNDYNHKKEFLSIDVDTQNQYKLNQLLTFVNDLYSFETKAKELAEEKAKQKRLELKRLQRLSNKSSNRSSPNRTPSRTPGRSNMSPNRSPNRSVMTSPCRTPKWVDEDSGLKSPSGTSGNHYQSQGTTKLIEEPIEDEERDMLKNANQALDTCDNMILLGDLLEDQLNKLKEFHQEFKTHILKFV